MRRRTFIGTAGALLGCGVLSGSAVAREEGHLPPGPVAHTVIQPWADGDEVPPGDWIVHRIGWVDEHREDILRFLDLIDIDAWIDGERIANEETYWRDIIQVGDRWFVWWTYATSPKPPGEHTFRTKLDFLGDYDETWPEGSGVDLTGRYVVDPR